MDSCAIYSVSAGATGVDSHITKRRCITASSRTTEKSRPQDSFICNGNLWRRFLSEITHLEYYIFLIWSNFYITRYIFTKEDTGGSWWTCFFPTPIKKRTMRHTSPKCLFGCLLSVFSKAKLSFVKDFVCSFSFSFLCPKLLCLCTRKS